MSRQKGFSLMEVMVVLAIVVTLAMLALPTYRQPIERVERTQAASCLMRLAGVLERHYIETGSYAGVALDHTGHACVARLDDAYVFDIAGLPDGDWSTVALEYPHWRLRARRVESAGIGETGQGRECPVLTLQSNGLRGVMSAGGVSISDAGVIRKCWH